MFFSETCCRVPIVRSAILGVVGIPKCSSFEFGIVTWRCTKKDYLIIISAKTLNFCPFLNQGLAKFEQR